MAKNALRRAAQIGGDLQVAGQLSHLSHRTSAVFREKFHEIWFSPLVVGN